MALAAMSLRHGTNVITMTKHQPRQIIAVVDTNLLLDLWSCHDMWAAYEKEPHGDTPAHLYRRVRAREALLLAMHLHRIKAGTWSLRTEAIDLLRKNVPTHASREFKTHFTTLFSHFVMSEILQDWSPGVDDGAVVRGDAADDALVAYAKEHGLPLISNEGLATTGQIVEKKDGLRDKARRGGIVVFTPEEYRRGKIEDAQAIEHFLQQFDAKAGDYIASFPEENRGPANDSLGWMLGYYHLVLKGITRDPNVTLQVSFT